MFELEKVLNFGHIAKVSFIFITIAVIAGGFVTQILPCQTQNFLTHNIYIKHWIGFLLIFCFIMMEGGWDFSDEENNKAVNDWSSGNTFHTMIWSIGLYILLLLSSKMRLRPNLLFFTLLFVLYVINTQRLYLLKRDRLSEKVNKNIVKFLEYLIIIIVLIFIYGIIDYYNYQKIDYGKKFTLMRFLIGKNTCKNIGNKHVPFNSWNPLKRLLEKIN